LIRSSSAPSCSDARAGFTLIEALVSLAIAAVLLSGVAMVAAQALRNWNRGHTVIAAMEMLTTGLARLGADLSLSLPMRPPGSDEANLLFKGDETNMMFVAATGFGAGNRGVELLTVSVDPDPDGVAVTRKRGPVQSLATVLSDPVVLMRGRMKVSFAYVDAKGLKSPTWVDKDVLPSAVEVQILGASGNPIFAVPAVLTLPTRVAVECLEKTEGAGGEQQDADAGDGEDDEDNEDVCPQEQTDQNETAQKSGDDKKEGTGNGD
jgi:prepilin-type N-terminal cleavage/methylation domain-containing protein